MIIQLLRSADTHADDSTGRGDRSEPDGHRGHRRVSGSARRTDRYAVRESQFYASARGRERRGGSGLTPALSYNSQLWRSDSGGVWKLGADVGYGFGFRLQAGSITPYYRSQFDVSHYTFVDSTGAEYRLDIKDPVKNTWTSKDGTYVTYDPLNRRLWFNDGSFWQMDCTSLGDEQDAGTSFPTLMQDSNGNQIRR